MFSKTVRVLIGAVLSLSLVVSIPSPVRAAETVNTKRAAKALLEGVRDFFKDLDEYQRLNTDEEKVQYILTKGSERIILKSGELAWDRMKSELAKVAETKVREALFKEQVPSMMHKVLVEKMSTSAAWTAANADIISKVDTRVNAVKTAVVTAKVIVKGLTDWRKTGDVRKGFEAFGKAAADEIMEYMVPGWKLYRVAQAIVEALCSYVTGYAFDTALESKVKAVLPFPPESNPKAFVDWIQTVNIREHVTREWDDQLAYSGWYLKFDGKSGTQEESGDAMKEAIIATLERMKSDILAEKAKMEAVQREFDQKIRELEMKSDEANKAAKAVLDGIFAKAEPYLKLIEDYQANLYGNQKSDLEAQISEAEAQMSAVPTSVTYNPVDDGSILAALETALSEITEDYRSGYDYEKADGLWDLYVEVRKRAIAENGKQFAELSAKLAQTKDTNEMNRLSKALHSEWPKKQQADLAALAAKEQLLITEATERCKKMVEDLKAAFQEINEEWMKALEDYQAAEEALDDKIQTSLKYPGVYSSPETSVPSSAPYLGDQRIPEEVLKAIEPLRLYKKEIESDAMSASGLQNQHRDNVKKLEGVYHRLKGQFESLVQKDYRRIKSGDRWSTESWTAYMHVTWMVSGPLQPLQDLRNEGESVVSVYISNRPWERLSDEIDVVDSYAKALRWLSETLGNLELMERPAALAASYWRLLDAPDLRKYEDDQLRAVDMERMGHMKDGKWGASVKPEESDGAKFIAQMKQDWAKWEGQILRAKDVREAYQKFGKNYFQYADPGKDRLLDQYLKIPSRIVEYEKALAVESQKFKTAREAVKGNLKIMQESFERLKNEVRYAIPSTPLLEKLEKYKKQTANDIRNTEILVPDAVTEIEGMKAIEAEVDTMIADCKTKMAAGPVGGGDGSGTGGSGAGGGGMGPSGGSGSGTSGGPVSGASYRLYDERINTHSLQNVSGDVALTNADLVNGTVEVTARLDPMDRIANLLISEDDGRTWAEIPVQQHIMYRFFPMPGKVYQLALRIKTMDSQETILRFFPNQNRILYRSIDYGQLVAEAIKKIAQAYEAQDIRQFEEGVARDYLGNRVFLVEGVRFDFDMFTDTRLSIYINRLEIRGNLFIADTKWDKTQMPRKTGQQQRTSGNTTFTFVLEDGQMKIQNLRGNLIYATLSPEIAEASGLSQTVIDEIRTAQTERDPVQPGAGETQDSGGVGNASNIQTGAFDLDQTIPHAAAGWIQEFSFTGYQVYTVDDFGPTHDFRRREGWMEVKASNGIVDLGGVGIDSVTEAPLTGYADQVGANEGNTYAIRLSDGTYALVQSTAWGGAVPSTTSFRYRHQRSGSRSFA
ncbi:MAG: hypothetical protein ACOY3K_06810 [Candidatus Omnitrophota bacterium]